MYIQNEVDLFSELFSRFYVEFGDFLDGGDSIIWIRPGVLKYKNDGGVGPSKHFSGDEVGWIGVDGYLHTKFKVGSVKKCFKCHRIVASLVVGRILSNSEVVDHIDGNKLNNDPRNLRVVTQVENSRNKIRSRNDSLSNLIGVSRLPSGSWRCRFQRDHSAVDRHIGVFTSPIDACNAYWDAKIVVEPLMTNQWNSVRKEQLKVAERIMKESIDVQ